MRAAIEVADHAVRVPQHDQCKTGLGRAEPALYNGAPALVLYAGDQLEGVVSVETIDGRITNFYAIRNPDKLTGVMVARQVSRSVGDLGS